jgi:peptide/nickel transport system substrate-binding protein
VSRGRTLLRTVAVAGVLAIVAAACGGNKGNPPPKGSPGTVNKPLKGGILKAALQSDVTAAMDPAREYYAIGWGILRIMNRTLLTYKAEPAPVGNQLVPDVAASMPQVSSDNLSWTYTLKPDVKFGPPISRPVVCADFKASFERMFTPAGAGGYNFYYTIIEGASDFKPGGDLTGVECQDDHTLVFHLTEPAGDFPFRTAMPATTPIPAAENSANGHDQDWGRFMVSTGPYMWLGEDKIDFSADAKSQAPAAGYQPNRSMTLVRNPDWDPSTDDVRKAYVDEIDIAIGGELTDLENKVQAGDLDFVEDGVTTPQTLQIFKADPALSGYISNHHDDRTSYLWMNLTVPPFDDVHVRKAVNWIINKDALRRILGGPEYADIATHIIPPTMAGALPASYDPYATPGERGDLTKAQDEMKQSKYDTNQDGVCDAPECKDVFWVTDQGDPYPDQTSSEQQDMQKIGITGRIRALDRGTMYNFYSTVSKKVAFGTGGGWAKDYSDMLTFIDPLFNGDNIQPTGNVNYGMVDDPTVNSKIAECKAATGDARNTCWDDIDKYLMETVVAWVPWSWRKNVRVYSKNIALPASGGVPFEQFSGGTAYDQVWLTQERIDATKGQVQS